MTDSKNSDEHTIYGGPTKRLFVSMLTRDIELGDAILDLIDNCVDGAMRQSKDKLNEEKPFAGYRANLTLANDRFIIEDNCGGIPEEFVEDAFKLGRPKIDKDNDLPTIGMYGIGMKRAVFKIGTAAFVESKSSDGVFRVDYSEEWLDPENDQWDLPITRGDAEAERGVTVHVTTLKKDIAAQFGRDAFINELKGQISEDYGYLIRRGFSILVNGEQLLPKTLALFNAENSDSKGIRPFDYETTFDDVRIKVSIGFFRGLAREQEIDDEAVSSKEIETAGITVVCNDRVIVLCDRTMKTGWGDGGVPRYHPQFRSIAGLIIFNSNNAFKLPISTTKRGLDVGSDVYLTARRAAIEGLKTFTDFTNKWKGMEEETTTFFEKAEKSDVKSSVLLARNEGLAVRGDSSARKYVPALPVPEERNPRRRISFARPDSEIKSVSKALFDDSSQKPAIVGAECFDRVLKGVKG